MKDDFDINEDIDVESIRGQSKKPSMSILNQKKVSKWELDELFADDYYEEF